MNESFFEKCTGSGIEVDFQVCPQDALTVCNGSSLVHFLLCTKDETSCLSPPALKLVLEGGIAALVLLAVGFIVLLFFICGLGFRIRSLKRKMRLNLTVKEDATGVDLKELHTTTDNEAMNTSAVSNNESKENPNKEQGNKLNSPKHLKSGEGDYHTLDHNQVRLAVSLPSEQVNNVVANKPSATPLLDDYSTISDVLAANAKVADNSGPELPGYAEIGNAAKNIDGDEQDSTQNQDRDLNNSTSNPSKEVPLYSEVNSDLKKSIDALDNIQHSGGKAKEHAELGEYSDPTAGMPLYSEVNKELKSSRQDIDENKKKSDDDIDEPVLIDDSIPQVPLYSSVDAELTKSKEAQDHVEGSQADIPLYSSVNMDLKRSKEALNQVGEDQKEMPLYSSVNMDLKKSKEALNLLEKEQNEISIDINPLDAVLDDITKLAEEFPVMESSPPPLPPPPIPVQLDLELFTQTNEDV